MKTRDKILKAAVKEFNKDGVAKVTTRQIASAMGISHGNLTYHFKNKQEILLAIYDQMYDFDGNIMYGVDESSLPERSPTLRYFHDFMVFIHDFEERYRFFYVHLAEVVRLCPDIGKQVSRNHEERARFFADIIRDLMQAGLLRPMDESILTALVDNIIFINTFWLTQQSVYSRGHRALRKNGALQQLWSLLHPYLTEAGGKKFQEISFE